MVANDNTEHTVSLSADPPINKSRAATPSLVIIPSLAPLSIVEYNKTIIHSYSAMIYIASPAGCANTCTISDKWDLRNNKWVCSSVHYRKMSVIIYHLHKLCMHTLKAALVVFSTRQHQWLIIYACICNYRVSYTLIYITI